MKKISICVPCYNEELNIEDCYKSITTIFKQLENYDYEIIFADNDSKDDSRTIIRKLVKQDHHVKAIFNARNFGPARNGRNVIYSASGSAVIGIPCDLQEPPEMIPEFIKYWEEGNLIVWGQKNRSKENIIKFSLRKFYYKIIKSLSTIPQYENCDGFGIIDKKVIELIKSCDEKDMAFRHIIADLGIKVKLIPYIQNARKKGKSSFNISRYFDFAVLSLITTSHVPLKIAIRVGLGCSILSFLCGFFYFVYKLLHWNSFSAGIAPVLISVFFLGSVQLFFIGIIGEYISTILDKVTKRPIVVEEERLGFESQTSSTDTTY